jgi:hypothetical protein
VRKQSALQLYGDFHAWPASGTPGLFSEISLIPVEYVRKTNSKPERDQQIGSRQCLRLYRGRDKLARTFIAAAP